jgi:hypothetical protein
MSQKKQPVFNLAKRLVFGLAIISAATAVQFLLQTPQSTQAYHASDCSDVYTPLSNFVTEGVDRNKAFYTQIMNETGVPWEMLAAIHYRETNFSHTNPSNGQGIFQFVNGNGGPYPAGGVSDGEFVRQLRFMANSVQNDYVNRGSAPRERRKLVPNEPNTAIVKDTLFSYNGRSSLYADQAQHFGYNASAQPYEGSPYVMNRFDCPRARMGIITRDYGRGIDGTDTRYGAFTVYARLRGESYWQALTMPYSWQMVSQESYSDSSKAVALSTSPLRTGQRIYMVIKARNIGSSTWYNTGSNPVAVGTNAPRDRTSRFCDTTWLSCSRAAKLSEASVAPGSIGTFGFWVKSPQSNGTYNEGFNLLAEGKTWMNDIGMYWPFGIQPDTYSWQFAGQGIYADPARTIPIDPYMLAPNSTYYVRIRATNTGNTDWTKGRTSLGTSQPSDRASVVRDSSWISSNRPATLEETQVSPGGIGTFSFSVKTPDRTGVFNEHFRAVQEGVSWMNDIGMYLPLRVQPPVYNWQHQGQAVYTNGSKTQQIIDGKIENGKQYHVVLKAKNSGNTVWQRGNVRLGTSAPGDRSSGFCNNSWLSCNRPATLTEASVAPGSIGTFEFSITAPYSLDGTRLSEYFRPLAEGKAWMNDLGMFYGFQAQSSDYSWEYDGQGIYKDAARTISADSNNLQRNTTYYLRLRAKNIGGVAWKKNVLNFATSNPKDRSSVMRDSSWPSGNRPTTLKEGSVDPGKIGTLEFSIKTPLEPGIYNEYFLPVADGIAWLEDVGQYWSLVVK